MKPTAPPRNMSSVFATTPCRGLSLSRLDEMIKLKAGTMKITATVIAGFVLFVVGIARAQEPSVTISTLLTRNLQDVFGENDPARRRAAIDEIWTEDGVFYDPKTGVHRGRDEIDRVAGAIRATHPDFRYQPIAEPEELGNGGRVQWVSGRPGEAPAYAGTDFIIARDGRIAALYLFFDKLP
jgi:hypothetical protein